MRYSRGDNMSMYHELGNRVVTGGLGAIPKSNDAYNILQSPAYENMGDINWRTGETYGILFSGAVVGVAALLLFNRYYK